MTLCGIERFSWMRAVIDVLSIEDSPIQTTPDKKSFKLSRFQIGAADFIKTDHSSEMLADV
jgi:hypothetical protein